MVSMARLIRFCGVSRETTMAPPPPVVQGQPLAVHRHRLDVRVGDVAAGGVLHPAGELAGDRGHDRRPREDRAREPAGEARAA